MLSLLPAAIISLAVIAALVAVEFYIARRREVRILKETAKSIESVQGHSDERIQETRKRVDAYQNRILAFMDEHNTLLREILAELKSRGGSS